MIKRLLAITSLLCVAACEAPSNSQSGAPIRSSAQQDTCHTRASDRIGGPIELINQDGLTVTEANYAGRHVLVFFGFTFCPDYCPFTLNGLHQAIEELPDDVEMPLTVMITIDPERDTQDVMKTYISNSGFPKDIEGLTGSAEQVDAAAKAFLAHYERLDDLSSTAGYTMDHTTITYLMDESWNLSTFFTHDMPPSTISACMAKLLPKAS